MVRVLHVNFSSSLNLDLHVNLDLLLAKFSNTCSTFANSVLVPVVKGENLTIEMIEIETDRNRNDRNRN